MGEDREHAAVVVVGRLGAEPQEDGRGVLGHGALTDHQPLAMAALLAGSGITKGVATLAVIGWRLVSFWLPIPFGAGAYLSLALPRLGRTVRRHGATPAPGATLAPPSPSPSP